MVNRALAHRRMYMLENWKKELNTDFNYTRTRIYGEKINGVKA